MRRMLIAMALMVAPGIALAQTVPGGERSDQGSGQSGAAKSGTTQPATGSDVSQQQHANDVRTSNAPLSLSDEQRQKIRDYVSSHRNAVAKAPARFTISIGAAVPRQIPLKPLPKELSEILQGYQGDQFALVQNQLVIATQGRRIAAIIPDVSPR